MRRERDDDEYGQARFQELLAQATQRADALEIELRHARQDMDRADQRFDRQGISLAAAYEEIRRQTITIRAHRQDQAGSAQAVAQQQATTVAGIATIEELTRTLHLRNQDIVALRTQVAALHAAGASAPSVPAGMPASAMASRANDSKAHDAQIASLSRRLRTAEEDVALQRSLATLLQDLILAFTAPGKWWVALLPSFWVRRIGYARLRRKGLFDARLYKQRYPDVRRAGLDPLQHYVAHGLEEGRSRN